MFNQFSDNRYSDGYQSHDGEKYESDDDQGDQSGLDGVVHKVASVLGKAAFDSCRSRIESHIELEGDTLASNIWEELQCFARKTWVREAAIISLVLIFKTG